MRIGNLELEETSFLAPMAGVSDLPFRLLCREYGAALCCTEMVSSRALVYQNKKTRLLLKSRAEEYPVAVQLFGSEPDVMGKAAELIREESFSVVDINMGCPMPKIVGNGDGAALMKDPVLAGRIIEAVVRTAGKPVTVKLRAGFDSQHKNAVELAGIAEESGAAAITVHGRTREQYYEGKSDWGIIADVKASVNIPVIGNGDITSFQDAERMRQETGCDGVAVGRASRGRPWIFKELKERRDCRPEREELVSLMLRHLELQIEESGEYMGVRIMRKHMGWYTAGLPNSAALRVKINRAVTREEMTELLQPLKERQS
ncbi:MAG: tRNA dihydrouridine synthase DusB [Lachnospiraceae bacterium]|nr:tRNA dihydrouridine synthase DusB [Lachnospiraceae bacterium]